MDKELMTIPEFISRYSISRTAIYREVNASRLSLTKRGRRTLIARADAEAWVKNLPKKVISSKGGANAI